MESLKRLCSDVQWFAAAEPDSPVDAAHVERYNTKEAEYRQLFVDHQVIGVEPVLDMISNGQLYLRCKRLRKAAETVWAMNAPPRPERPPQSPPHGGRDHQSN